jgi:PAS domain S-box-containing protein
MSAARLDLAARAAIAARFGRFTAGCLVPMVVWVCALSWVDPANLVPALVTLGAQGLVLAAAWRRIRLDPRDPRVASTTVAAGLAIAAANVALFVRAGTTGEVIGFVLFTICAMSALVFPWGWRRESVLTAGALALLAAGGPWTGYALPAAELVPVIAIAAILCVAIAEGHARNFHATLRRRWSEEEARRELAASRDTYRDITENARDFIWASDLEGRLTYVNETGARILGFAPAELLGRNVDEHIAPPQTNAANAAALRAHLASGGVLPPTVLEWRSARGRMWVEVVAYAVRDADGTVVGFRGISRDVTERWLAETALRESEARYRGLVESQDALIYRADLDGNLTFLNDACRRKYGVEDTPLAELNFLTFVHPDDVEGARTILRTVHAGDRYRRTSRGRTPEGWRWVEWEVCAIADAAGTITEVQGVGRDVTERKSADEALQQSLAALREREEQLRLMGIRQTAIREDERKRLGFDLHDGVCQELVGIGILVESARQRGVSASAAATLATVQRHLRTVGEHLRLLARELRPLQLSDLGLGECLRALAKGMAENGPAISVDVPSDLPRLSEEVEVAVYRVAQEALANAVRHAHADAIALTVTTDDLTLALEVRDDGRGFDRDALRSRALGLVAMEERAVALGGRLAVRSAPGAGTTIRLECPIGRDVAEAV